MNKPLNGTAAANEIMNCEDFTHLAELQMGCVERIGEIDIAISKCTTSVQMAKYRADKRTAYHLLDLCKSRIKTLRDTNARLNHNFRMVAAEHLNANAYQHIEELARMPLKKR